MKNNSRIVFHVLAVGCNHINSKKMMEGAELYNHHISFSSLTNQVFRKHHFHVFLISQKQKDYLNFLKMVKLESPNSTFVILVEDITFIQEVIESKELFFILDKNHIEKLEYSLYQLWQWLLILNAQKYNLDHKNNCITVASGVLSLSEESYQKADTKYQLTRKQMDILKILLEYRGEIVSRITLMERIWSSEEKIVTDRVIDTNIVALRKMLGDNGKHPIYLQTIFGQGYRLTLE